MTLNLRNHEKGEALTIVLIVVILLAIISATLMTLGYNQRKLQQKAVGGQIIAYYYARAGVVDAFWRLQRDIGPGGEADYFTTGAGSTAETVYARDVDGILGNDVNITIGLPNAGLRQITTSDI